MRTNFYHPREARRHDFGEGTGTQGARERFRTHAERKLLTAPSTHSPGSSNRAHHPSPQSASVLHVAGLHVP
jgi:hypothetical protein